MRRRDFIRGITAVSAAWPLAGRAQHPGMPVMGLLHSASPEPYAPQMSVFRQSLKEAGYVEGQNVTIEFRWAENQIARLPTLAAELVHRQVSVIVAGGSPVAALAAKSATTTIPIVFMNAADPVGIGLVASFNRPGGNVTGATMHRRYRCKRRLRRSGSLSRSWRLATNETSMQFSRRWPHSRTACSLSLRTRCFSPNAFRSPIWQHAIKSRRCMNFVTSSRPEV